jgi:hypothetical protein
MVDLNQKKNFSFGLIISFGANFRAVRSYRYVLQGVWVFFCLFFSQNMVGNEFFLV